MNLLECNPYSRCEFGDKRLTRRAVLIGECLSVKYGQPLSTLFKSASDLKRAYEFLANAKTTFEKLIEPYYKQTVENISGLPVVLAVGDTTYLDYKKIIAKREDYGPIGNGGNGLILHTACAIDPDLGQPLGLLWQKLWHREKPTQPPQQETPQQKKQRLQQERQLKKKRSPRVATLEIRFCPVKLRTPRHLTNQDSFEVYAVYAREINPPPTEEPVEWMLLTSESVTTPQEANQILRWYTFRWRVEEYHKILKSGCKAESYRLAACSMSTLLGFLSVIASQLLRMTYLHRNCPDNPAANVLSPVQIDVLLALSPAKLKHPANLTIDWAMRCVRLHAWEDI